VINAEINFFELLEMQFEIILLMIYLYVLDCNSLYLFQRDISEDESIFQG